MKIRNLICSTGRSGYFNKDLAAIRAGRGKANGLAYEGEPMTPGFTAISQPGATVSVMLLLEDGQVAFGDCADVVFTGAAGRDPIFQPEAHLPVLNGAVRETLIGRDCGTFRPLAEELDAFAPGGKRLHTALRYGVTQALLHAAALTNRETAAEVVAREYGGTIARDPIPILGMCPTSETRQIDKMILKRVDILPHASFANVPQDVGENGEILLDYAGLVARRVREIGAPDYRPTVHLDVYGAIGALFDMDIDRMAAFIGEMKNRVDGLDLMVETPVIADTMDAQIAIFKSLRAKINPMGVQLIADEWCNTLEDIKVFADADAADHIQVKTPDLGGLNNTIEALLYCRKKGVGAYIGGTCNETDQSAKLCAHIALACNADIMMCKPGQGVDEGLLILVNEMQRTLAQIGARGAM
jgi:methylaspartate ammonia-lyase